MCTFPRRCARCPKEEITGNYRYYPIVFEKILEELKQKTANIQNVVYTKKNSKHQSSAKILKFSFCSASVENSYSNLKLFLPVWSWKIPTLRSEKYLHGSVDNYVYSFVNIIKDNDSKYVRKTSPKRFACLTFFTLTCFSLSMYVESILL